VPYFQVLGKNERDSQDSSVAHFDRHYQTDKDSGYSDRSTTHDRMSTRATPGSGMGSMPAGGGGGGVRATGSPLYGVVLYDFNAERPDELEAKTGEDIIVIAQSNDEWFVAKPIGRLGGPGLIPVDFVEIRDMATGAPVEDKRAAIARAGVPKVEEWKKMAAEYKNSSIALGQFEFEDGTPKPQAPPAHDLGNNRNVSPRHTGPLLRTLSTHVGSTDNRTSQTLQPAHGNGGATGYDNPRLSRGSTQGLLMAPVSASVDDYNFESSRYWYVVNAVMEDGRTWSLCRFYEDFYDFQIALLDEFKEEAGHTGLPRQLPYMPGPVTYVTDTISAARRQSLDEYIKKLLAMPSYISKCRLVKLLFAPRPGDVETTHYRGSQQLAAHDNRRSTASQQSSDSSREPSRQSSIQNLNGGGGGGNGYPGLSAPPPRMSGQVRSNGIAQAQQVHIRSASDLQPPRMLRQESSMSSTGSGQFLKIKIEYHDEMIAVRLPRDVSFAQLQDKLQERLGQVDLNNIQYKDEATGQVLDLYGDSDLNTAISRNPKLKLFVN